ncbi:uncharacterized protein LY79DRAFT_586375 [Colletotrichum navitas]|uniref:Uncharacterized protein n=1 Tax=Colletotrichum navitas TaxID=681940 RepID=A0AAD8VBU8_9PEZI|nr:uncharacterized protein LY79DRAFT_586375 [Colletotrichum navitas]KAK1598835.1 hypothetical protein LY79DRAFT_586375 [Colletotrichum navitas]
MLLPCSIEVLTHPGITLSRDEKTKLQDSFCHLGRLCLSPLPKYQVFDKASPTSLDDKVIVVSRCKDEVIAFLSAIWLPITSPDRPLLHSGLTVIHPAHRGSGISLDLYAHLCLHLINKLPDGFWTSTLAAVISSLVNVSIYTTQVFPSPGWSSHQSTGQPSAHHLAIAQEISANHRDKMLISPSAVFDENSFVFRGSNNSDQGESFRKDIDDQLYWHRDQKASAFFRNLLRPNTGDEVLQISYLDPKYLAKHMKSQRFAERYSDRAAKVHPL